MKKIVSLKKGFTLLEILLVVGIIAILAGIVILAINPAKQLADTRNAQRRSDILAILNATYQYEIDKNGAAPATIATGATCQVDPTNAIATSSATSSSIGSVDLYDYLVTGSSTYLNAIPKDPLSSTSTGYYIVKNTTTGRITVCAAMAENGASLSVTR